MFNSNTINKNLANENFKHTMWQAKRDSLLSKFRRNPPFLKTFDDALTDSSRQKRSRGVQEIPLDKITGTVGRQDDFDGRFRPLKEHLRERWVNIALLANEAGWPAIEVFKVGEEYFVLDGHHRTSYARTAGMAFIDAVVWEFVQPPGPPADSVINAQRELFSQKELADEIVIHDSMACCCA